MRKQGITVTGPGRSFTWDGHSRYAHVADGEREYELLLDTEMAVSRKHGVIVAIGKRPTVATFKAAVQRYIERSDTRLLTRERERIAGAA